MSIVLTEGSLADSSFDPNKVRFNEKHFESREYKSREKVRDKLYKFKKTPRIFCLFTALVIFQRYLRNAVKRLRHQRGFEIRYKGRSPLHSEIVKSNRAVLNASHGRAVMIANETSEYIIQQVSENLKRLQDNDNDSIPIISPIIQNKIKSPTYAVSRTKEVTHQSLLNTIHGLRSHQNINRNDTISVSTSSHKRTTSRQNSSVKDTFPIDMSGVEAKNARISSKNIYTNAPTSGVDMLRNFKSIRKLDLQEVLDYVPGTAIYFGATVAVQAVHGGYLTHTETNEINASVTSILPSARFTIRNSDDLNDLGVMRYGDAVWLQAGVNEVVGAQYGGKVEKSEELRTIHPSLINCRRANLFKAQQYGRWIVLKANSPAKSLGEQVLHHDSILLEQEWYYLASTTPSESFIAMQLENTSGHFTQ
eukprot:gene4544-9016_t